MVSVGSVDGLISGMNTSQVIAQLMQIEAAPQTNLKSQVSHQNLIIAAYQAVNSKMATLQTAAEAFTPPNALTPTNPTWQAVKATSSDSSVTATATAGATVGSLSFDVTSLANAQVTTADFGSGSSSTSTATAGGATSIAIQIGSGTPNTINLTDTSVAGVAAAINAAKLGVTASVLTVDDPNNAGATKAVLQLTGDKTGVANSFSITGLSVNPATMTAATDARITVGNPTSGGYTISSPTNTFTNVLNNVTLTVTKVVKGTPPAGNAVTLSVAADPGSMADKMQALVDAANAALAQIGTYTAYDSTAKSGGVLTGDYTVRTLRDNILSVVSTGLSGYGSYKQFGVELDKTGKLTFDRDAFLNAYSANPASVQTGVANGLAKSMDTVAKNATDFVSGTLTTAIQSGQSQVTDLNKRITDWDTRLAARQTALKRQFAAMEAALGQLKNQSTWLSGQLASLPVPSSSGN